jgi:hypothetical protein
MLKLFKFSDRRCTGGMRSTDEILCTQWKLRPSATLSNANPNDLGSREIFRCVTNRRGQGTNQDFTNVNINYVSTNVKYGIQCDAWYAACTVISNVPRKFYRCGLKFCLQLWGWGWVSTRCNSCTVRGIYPTVVEQDNSIASMWCMQFDHWMPCASARNMYLKKQRYQTIFSVIFQT